MDRQMQAKDSQSTGSQILQLAGPAEEGPGTGPSAAPISPTTCPICFDNIEDPNVNPQSDQPGPSHIVQVGSSSEAGEADGHAERIEISETVGSSSGPRAPLLEGSGSREDG